MRKTLRGIAVGLFLASSCAGAQEDGLRFGSSIDLVYKRVDSESAITSGGATIVSNFNPELWMVDLGLRASYRGLYTVVSLGRTLGEADSSGLVNNGTTWTDSRSGRKENTATAGYSLAAGFSVFLGYQQVRTIRTFTNHAVSGAVLTQTGDSELVYKGPFAGIGYAHRFAESGVLSASVAKAKMKGVSDQKTVTESGTATFNLVHGEGDVEGLGYSLIWTAPLTGSLSYRFGYRGTRYDFTRTSATNNGVAITAAQTNKQNFDSIVLGIVSFF